MNNDGVLESTTTIPMVGYDYLTPLLRLLFGEGGLISSISVEGFVGFLSSVWTIYAIIAYAFALLFMYLYVKASIGLGELSEEESRIIANNEQAFRSRNEINSQSPRLSIIQNRIESEDPNDWKLAIIEADVILDQALKRRGYGGTSLGERLKSISPTMLQSLDDAWQAHKVRNFIAHGDHEFVLTPKVAKETIVRYQRVFAELEIV